MVHGLWFGGRRGMRSLHFVRDDSVMNHCEGLKDPKQSEKMRLLRFARMTKGRDVSSQCDNSDMGAL